MKKILILLFAVLLTNISFAQSGAEIYSSAMNAFNQRNYSEAYSLFEKFFSNYGIEDDLFASAKYYSAESLLRAGETDGAIAHFESFTDKYEWSNFNDDALYKLGGLYFQRNEFDKSRGAFLQLLNKYPQSEFYGSSMFFVGETYTKQNRTDEAIRFFENAISSKRQNKFIDESIYSLANIYEKKGDYENAAKYYNQLLDFYPNSNLAPSAQIRIGLTYFNLKNYNVAVLELSDPLINKLPEENQIEAKYVLGNSYYRLQEYDDAEKTFKELLQNYPNANLKNDIKYSLAWVNFQRGRYSDSYDLFSEVARSGKDSLAIDALFRSGESRRYAGKESEANKIFDEFLEKYPQSSLASKAKFQIGAANYSTNKEKVSEDYLVEAANSKDIVTAAKANILLGELKLNQKDFVQAQNYFERSVQTEQLPENSKAKGFFGLGVAKYFLNQFDAAIQNLKLAESNLNGEEKNKANFYLAESYFAKKDYRKAIESYDKVKSNDKAIQFQNTFGKAYAYFNAKDFSNAAFHFNEFIKNNKNSAKVTNAKLRLADSYYGIKRYNDASRIYREIFMTDNSHFSGDYAHYQFSQALYRAGNADEAIKEFANLQQKYPDSKYAPESQYLVGWINFQKGNFTGAISDYQTVIERYPNSAIVPLAYNSIGNSYFNVGNYSLAIDNYQRVLNEFPTSSYVYEAVSGMIDAYSVNDNINQAVAVIDNFVTRNPNSNFADEILFKKGELYYSQRNYERSKDSYKEFVNKYPNSKLAGDAYYWIGKSSSNLAQTNEALFYYNIVSSKYTNSEAGIASILEMGKIHSDLKNYDSAIQIYQSAINKLPPESQKIPEILYAKALVNVNKGDISEAYQDFTFVIQYYDGTIFAANSKLEVALIELVRQSYQSADALLREVAENRADDIGAKAQYYLGVSLFEQKKLDEAVTALVRVRFVFSGYDEWLTKSLLKLGEVYEAKNDVEKAKEMYRLVFTRHRGDEYGNEAQSKLRNLE